MVLSITEKDFSHEVLAAEAPVIVTFWAPWCGLCQRVEPLLSQFQENSCSPVKLVRVNADENLRLASKYRLTTLPTVLLFEQGKVVNRLEGMQGYIEVKDALKQLLPQHSAVRNTVVNRPEVSPLG
jgi:thioredoxin 1